MSIRRGRDMALGLGVCAAALVAGCGSPATPSDSYGSLPTYLNAVAPQHHVPVVSSAQRPALASEGEVVTVQLGGGTLTAQVTGPEVPGEGLPYQSPATTCTWTVTLADASAPTAIDLADFTAIDHLGAVYPVAAVAGSPVVPGVLDPGQTVNFQVRAVMPTGEGLMRWAPNGKQVVASWDFEVEND